ncbi:ABC-type transport auxiliary lipoprotein family protein [Sulfuritalea sp.]|uniref:ABC-type transport auxiliary lipoprotein family protein n=1 Tax=Sulfuritalea sp. TaxID=2480090 RepID=UPI00286DA055|nr:ABC-type transport auxiliary lipoprotein family protein [Sulfuritalea sp.]
MSKWLAMILAGSLLAACGGNVRTAEPVRYDFGSSGASIAEAAAPLPLAAIEVRTASWLAGTAMHFRLAYAEPLRRQSYGESRWAAPPAELLEVFLKRRLALTPSGSSGTGCRLQLVLDELEQRFDDPQRSRLVLEARAVLTPLHGSEILSRRVFLITQPAATADAGAGAAAARAAVQALAADLGNWLGQLAREKPAIVERCRS